MKKGFFAGLLCGCVVAALIGTASATVGRQPVEVDYNDINVVLNGTEVSLVDANGNPVEPFAINGTTYLPVRAVASALGLNVGWIGETTTVTLDTPEEERPIYITQSGKRYHYDDSCNGGTYFEAPLKTAIGMGLTPCDKCVLKKNG